jgi:hypothetical protein
MIAGASFETMLSTLLNSIQNERFYVRIIFVYLEPKLRCCLNVEKRKKIIRMMNYERQIVLRQKKGLQIAEYKQIWLLMKEENLKLGKVLGTGLSEKALPLEKLEQGGSTSKYYLKR